MPKATKELIDKLAFKGKKLSKREKMMPIMVATVIVLTIIIFLGPIIKTIKENKENLKKNRDELAELVKKRKTLENIENGEVGLKLDDQYKNTENYLPSFKPSLEVLLNLTMLARMDQVNFSGVTLNPGNVKDEDNQEENQKVETINVSSIVPKNYELSVSISGEREKIYKFITDIKELSPLMKIEKISTSFEEGSDGNNNLNMNATMNLLVYYLEIPSVFSDKDYKFEYLTDEELALLDSIGSYLFTDSRFKTIDSGVYGVPVGVTNLFGAGQ